MSILPGLNSAGSSLSLWLVVNMMILSSPQLDHNPSMKFSNPDKVNCIHPSDARLAYDQFQHSNLNNDSDDFVPTILNLKNEQVYAWVLFCSVRNYLCYFT